MCELILSVVSFTATDPAVQSKIVQRGVVVAVFEDGHAYAGDELINPMFRILRLPGVPMAFGEDFLGGELPASPDADTRFLLKWQYKLDIDSPILPADLQAYLADDTRAASAYTVDEATLPLAILSGLKVMLPSIQADSAIGLPPSTIG